MLFVSRLQSCFPLGNELPNILLRKCIFCNLDFVEDLLPLMCI